MEYFVVYAADNASLIALRDLLVNGEVKERMEVFGLGIGNRDICERVPFFVNPATGSSWAVKAVIELIIPSHTTAFPGWANSLPFLHLVVTLDAYVVCGGMTTRLFTWGLIPPVWSTRCP